MKIDNAEDDDLLLIRTVWRAILHSMLRFADCVCWNVIKNRRCMNMLRGKKGVKRDTMRFIAQFFIQIKSNKIVGDWLCCFLVAVVLLKNQNKAKLFAPPHDFLFALNFSFFYFFGSMPIDALVEMKTLFRVNEKPVIHFWRFCRFLSFFSFVLSLILSLGEQRVHFHRRENPPGHTNTHSMTPTTITQWMPLGFHVLISRYFEEHRSIEETTTTASHEDHEANWIKTTTKKNFIYPRGDAFELVDWNGTHGAHFSDHKIAICTQSKWLYIHLHRHTRNEHNKQRKSEKEIENFSDAERMKSKKGSSFYCLLTIRARIHTHARAHCTQHKTFSVFMCVCAL